MRCSQLYVTPTPRICEAGYDPLFVQLLPSRRNGVHDVQHASRTIFHCAG